MKFVFGQKHWRRIFTELQHWWLLHQQRLFSHHKETIYNSRIINCYYWMITKHPKTEAFLCLSVTDMTWPKYPEEHTHSGTTTSFLTPTYTHAWNRCTHIMLIKRESVHWYASKKRQWTQNKCENVWIIVWLCQDFCKVLRLSDIVLCLKSFWIWIRTFLLPSGQTSWLFSQKDCFGVWCRRNAQ